MFNEHIFCGLGTGVGETGALPEAAIDEAVTAIVRFVRLAQESGVDRIDAFATSAVRDATNGDELVAAVFSQTGCNVRILSGDEEASLSTQAVMRGLHTRDGIVADLGGGSLELAHVRNGESLDLISLPLGSMRLHARHSGDMNAISAEIASSLGSISWLSSTAGLSLYPIGGAWRAFARLKIKDSAYPLDIIHGYAVSPGSVLQTANLLAAMSAQSLQRLSNVVKQRRAAMPLTAMMLSQLVARLKPREVVFSAVGVREGYVFENLPPDQRADDPLAAAATAFGNQAGRFGVVADALMDWIEPVVPHNNAERRRLQEAVCLLSDLAWREHPDYRAGYAFDRAIEHPFFGISHRDRAFIALAIYLRYGGKADDARVECVSSLLSKRAVRRAETLGYALRLAYRVSGGSPALLEQSRLVAANGKLSLILPGKGAAPNITRIQRSFERLCETRHLRPGKIATADG